MLLSKDDYFSYDIAVALRRCLPRNYFMAMGGEAECVTHFYLL